MPTKFRAAINGSALELSWEAPSDPAGGWELLRSASAFAVETVGKAEVIQKLPPRQRAFAYSPTDGKAWYYAILPLAGDGSALISILPGKTVTALAIAIPASKSPTSVDTTKAAAPSAKSSAMAFSGSVDGSALRLSFVIPPGSGTMLVYRSERSFVDGSSLLAASLLSSLPESTTSFIDFPIPGTDYYYALIREADLKAGTISFAAGAPAATLGPISIPATGQELSFPETGDLARTYPLPSWLFAKPGDPGVGSSPGRISTQTEKAIAAILAPFPKSKPKAPTLALLQEDRGQARGGEEYALSLILQGAWRSGNWVLVIEQLQSYLSLNRSPSIASRAHFYLGQAYAMTGHYRDAFFEFLSARDFHAGETRPWLLWIVAMERNQ